MGKTKMPVDGLYSLPGKGKTQAAEEMANRLGFPLVRFELSLDDTDEEFRQLAELLKEQNR